MVLNVINQNNTTTKPLNQNRMKTAVEWLVAHFKKLQSEGEKMSWNQIIQITELVKEMDKEHIKNAFNEGYTQCSIEDLKPTSRKRYEDAEQYYNETFKSE